MTEIEAWVARPGNRARFHKIGRRAAEAMRPTPQRPLTMPSCAGGSIAMYLSTAFSKWRTRIS